MIRYISIARLTTKSKTMRITYKLKIYVRSTWIYLQGMEFDFACIDSN